MPAIKSLQGKAGFNEGRVGKRGRFWSEWGRCWSVQAGMRDLKEGGRDALHASQRCRAQVWQRVVRWRRRMQCVSTRCRAQAWRGVARWRRRMQCVSQRCRAHVC